MNKLLDNYGRSYRYLRVSVTDRCNFRCKYCMPQHQFEFMPHSNILSYEKMLFAIRGFSELGVDKVRITGGEPLLRKNIIHFLNELKKNELIREITLTTNGSKLKQYASELINAGIKRINVSLDSLKQDRYSYITGGSTINNVLEGIKSAQDAGINPVKINVVVIKGFNDDEILDFCEFSADNNIIVRFIEFMPIGNYSEWKQSDIITGKDILEKIGSKYNLEKIERKNYEGPALNYDLSNSGKIGIITPISNHFCGECDKLRLTADGKIRPCLLSDVEINIMPYLINGDMEGLKDTIISSIKSKNFSHQINDHKQLEEFSRTMSKIGG